MLGGSLREVFQVVDRSELRMDGIVPAGLVADRPRGAGVGPARNQCVVTSLSVGVADRMDRGEVDDVEAQLGKARDLLLDALQAAP